MSGDSADNNAAYFYNGAYDVLKPYIDSGVVQVLSGQKDFYTTSTQWSGENARSRMEILLGTYYSSSVTLHGVLCANDSTASGVMEALERDYHMDNSVVITGQDCDVSNLDAIMEGKQSMSVYKDLNQEAQTAVELTKAILNGESVNASLADRMEFPCRYDTSQYNNGIISVPSFLLEPETVTADNATDILVEKYGSYTYGELGFQRVME
ncbi:MAG: substrate-binding domain-containing protein [Lachnospiraceae bacterium]|nr:substrate-binding domain-containing protein [Lachnospiraceae bacterium]